MLLHSYILRPTRSESARARKDMHTGGPSARMRALQKRRYSVSQNSNMNLDKVMIASAPSCHVTPRVTPRPLPPPSPCSLPFSSSLLSPVVTRERWRACARESERERDCERRRGQSRHATAGRRRDTRKRLGHACHSHVNRKLETRAAATDTLRAPSCPNECMMNEGMHE